MIKLIIFDWDDVFTLGSKEGYFACYHAMLEDLGIRLEQEEERKRVLARWGQTYQAEVEELLKDRSELIEQGYDVYLKHLFGNEFVDKLSITTGTKQFLERLHRKYKLALATGVHPKLLREKIMPKFEIPNVFTEIITSQDVEDTTHTKPHPFMVEELMRRLNVAKEETIVVGDAEHDVKMAQNAGVTPVVVLTGHLSQKEAEALGVKYIISDVTKLEDILL